MRDGRCAAFSFAELHGEHRRTHSAFHPAREDAGALGRRRSGRRSRSGTPARSLHPSCLARPRSSGRQRGPAPRPLTPTKWSRANSPMQSSKPASAPCNIAEPLIREKLEREHLRADLAAWARSVLAPAGLEPAAHHLLLLKELERLARGEIDRLMILMPPGSAKSTYASMIFPAWWFVQHPGSAVIAASHTDDLALHFGRAVRNLDRRARVSPRLHARPRQSRRWSLADLHKGQYFATGVRGPVAGRRADLIIIDDPIKSQAEADSAMLRDHIWNWYRSDLTTRLKPGGRIVLIMTRWHEDDLGGRLLASQPGEWQVLRLPAIAEEGDPLGRAARDAAVARMGGRGGARPQAPRRRRTRVVRAVPADAAAAGRVGVQDRRARSSRMADARCPMAGPCGPGTSPPRAMPEAAIPTGRSA